MSLKTEEKKAKIPTKSIIKKVNKDEKYEGIIQYDTPHIRNTKNALATDMTADF